MRSDIPVQVDGEPWIQPPGDVVVFNSALKVSNDLFLSVYGKLPCAFDYCGGDSDSFLNMSLTNRKSFILPSKTTHTPDHANIHHYSLNLERILIRIMYLSAWLQLMLS